MKILGKRSKLDLILARSLCAPDTLLVLRTKIARCPLGLEITKGASSGRRTAGGETDSDQTDSSQTTPKCASCHKKDKKLPALSYVLFAYSFILQMLFLCHFLLNVISYLWHADGSWYFSGSTLMCVLFHNPNVHCCPPPWCQRTHLQTFIESYVARHQARFKVLLLQKHRWMSTVWWVITIF